jgi:hypothetical protein
VLVRFLAADGDHDGHTRRVVERVQQDGTCWMSGTTWQGRAAMRISVSNWTTDEADVDRSVAAILCCAQPGGMGQATGQVQGLWWQRGQPSA